MTRPCEKGFFMLPNLSRLIAVLLAALTAGFVLPAQADTLGLRITPRTAGSGADNSGPGSLRFSVSRLDSMDSATTPLVLSLGQSDTSSRNNAIWADWYLFGSSGLRTSAGLVWRDPSHNNFDTAVTSESNPARPRAFLGLGWTSTTSSSSSRSGWRLSADLGASLSSPRDCTGFGSQCATIGGNGLKPVFGGGDGIRWNPFISIGASYQY